MSSPQPDSIVSIELPSQEQPMPYGAQYPSDVPYIEKPLNNDPVNNVIFDGPPQENPTGAQLTRELCQPPTDTESKSSKLYYKMAKVVGAVNILPPPASFTSEKDRLRWLKYDSNGLLYFWYKNKKKREAIQKQADRCCCCRMITDNEGNWTSSCSEICCMTVATFFVVGIFCWPIWCKAKSENYNSIIENSSGYQNFSSEKNFGGTPQQLQHYSKSWKSKEKYNEFRHIGLIDPMRGAGFTYEEDSWTSCCTCYSCCCSDCYQEHYRNISNEYHKQRYGPLVQLGTNYKDPFVLYQTQCTYDKNHPASNNKTIVYRSQLGIRGCTEDGETIKPFHDLNINKFDDVVRIHNEIWGKIHPLKPELLDMDSIFPGQSK